jgi:ketosteroid isomerase-like protein
MDRRDVAHWIGSYERAWRMPGTEELTRLFAPGATYSQGPYKNPVEGLEAIAEMWEAERRGPDEDFTMTSALVALDGDVAVARVEVHYRYEGGVEYRDLWVMRFGEDGLCTAFEEWPFAPDLPGA